MNYIIILFILLFHCVCAKERNSAELLQGIVNEGITVDLREPTLCNGVLSTDKGGVIQGQDIRIQAKHLIYQRREENGVTHAYVEAEGELILELGEYVFVGEKLHYDFQNRTGVLYCARTSIAPWYMGGDEIHLREDGSYFITNGYVTTSDSLHPDWYISANETEFIDYRYLRAKFVQFRFFDTTLFALGALNLDLRSIMESPIRYSIGWGGQQGPRIGMSYEIFSWNRFKAFLRLDYRLRRGLGGGLETRYRSEDHKEIFQTINYFARDSAIFHPHEKYRYRFQGVFHKELWDDKLTIDLTYDKLSDKYMAIDYADQSLEIAMAERTQLDIHRQEEMWISNILARVKINSFDTVKQELPTFYTTWKPFEISSTGIISDNQLELSYLDFDYSNKVVNAHDYSASRLAFYQSLYRPFYMGPVTMMPEIGSTTIFYGNSPDDHSKWVLLGQFGGSLFAPLYRFYGNCKHVFTPYADYTYYTFPTTSPDDHYIFDISDGWYRLDQLRFGTTHSFYLKNSCGCIWRYLYMDLYANAFFDTRTIPATIPRIYADIVYNVNSYLRYTVDTAWNFPHRQIDYFNIRAQWTASKNFAVSLEYRHRSRYDWRKANHDNFILDSFRSERELLHSPLSDRRDTALLHFFYRFHPNWAIEYEARHGWNRKNRTRFTEFEIDLSTMIRSSARLRLSYQHKESEDRVAVYFSVWPQGPETPKENDFIPCTDY